MAGAILYRPQRKSKEENELATYTGQLQKIVDKYIEAGEEWPATTRQMAAWAVREKLWEPHPASVVSQCAEALTNAMREKYYY